MDDLEIYKKIIATFFILNISTCLYGMLTVNSDTHYRIATGLITLFSIGFFTTILVAIWQL